MTGLFPRLRRRAMRVPPPSPRVGVALLAGVSLLPAAAPAVPGSPASASLPRSMAAVAPGPAAATALLRGALPRAAAGTTTPATSTPATTTPGAATTSRPSGRTPAARTLVIGAITDDGPGGSATEARLLSELYAGALRADGWTVQVRRPASRASVAAQLEEGRLDLVVDAGDAALAYWSTRAATPTTARSSRRRATTTTIAAPNRPFELARALGDQIRSAGLLPLLPSPASRGLTFALLEGRAAELDLQTVAGLSAVSRDLVLGGPPECEEQRWCLSGLRQSFGVRFAGFVALGSSREVTQALRSGEVDLGLVSAADPELAGPGLRLLDDNRAMLPSGNLIPLVRGEKLTPDLRGSVDAVSAALDSATLAGLYGEARRNRRDVRLVAQRWLRDRAFIR